VNTVQRLQPDGTARSLTGVVGLSAGYNLEGLYFVS